MNLLVIDREGNALEISDATVVICRGTDNRAPFHAVSQPLAHQEFYNAESRGEPPTPGFASLVGMYGNRQFGAKTVAELRNV